MEDFLSKEHYRYKIHALITEKGLTPTSIVYRTPYPPSILQEILDSRFYDFFKNSISS